MKRRRSPTPIRIPLVGSRRRLRVIAFSDLRVQPLDVVVTWLRRRREAGIPFDLVVYAGDDIARFRPHADRNYFELIAAETTYGLVGVIGNDDLPEVRELLAGHRVYDVHARSVMLGPARITGLEGAPDTRPLGYVLSSERAIARHLRERLPGRRMQTMVVSHAPPHGCLDEAIRFGHAHIGSTALATVCRDTARAPNVVVCGHAHLCGCRAAKVANTHVINAASHDSPGAAIRYVSFVWNVNLRGGVTDIEGGELKLHEELERVHHIGDTRGRLLVAGGIATLDALAAADPVHVGQLLGWRPHLAKPFVARARALLENRAIPLGPLNVPPGPRVYYDIETDSTFGTRFVWLISCLDEASGEFTQFLAPTPRGMRRILRQFAEYCDARPYHRFLSYSGSNFDRNRLALHFTRSRIPEPVQVTHSVDCLRAVECAVALPCEGVALKVAAKALGFTFRHPDMDGFFVALAYESAVRGGERISRSLLEYAEDDVRSLAHVIQRVGALTAGQEMVS